MSGAATYVCGHSPAELARLQTQGAFFEPITRRMFDAAGIAPGMRVLDLGCGAGDVSLLAAELVGPGGRVVGIDRALQAIEVARARAESLGRRNVDFRHHDIETLKTDEIFDAVVGRFILMHQPKPASLLRAASRHLKPHGVVAMIESQMQAMRTGAHSYPTSLTYERIMHWMLEVLEAAGAHSDMGLRLHETFIEAGLPPPTMSMEARVEGGPDALIYRYTIESLRSMLPTAERLGIASMTAAEVAALEARLREEAISRGGVLTSPILVGAWCRSASR